jgi:hypothetical protein
LIAQHLKDQQLSIFPETELTDVITNYVHKQDSTAIAEYVSKTLTETLGGIELSQVVADDDKLTQAIKNFKESRLQAYQESMGDRPVRGSTLRKDFDFSSAERISLKKKGLCVDDGFEDNEILKIKPSKSVPNSRGSRRLAEEDSEELEDPDQNEDIQSNADSEIVETKPIKRRKIAAPTKTTRRKKAPVKPKTNKRKIEYAVSDVSLSEPESAVEAKPHNPQTLSVPKETGAALMTSKIRKPRKNPFVN